ncbi:MAG: SDR family NAD(P)-dependent oxidoreductase [Kangiellaceae bacterium]|nr:SDR family NAD(P)-dependent oxidoreductase [Kangiellaceae bacterium]
MPVKNLDDKPIALVIGASSAIATAMLCELSEQYYLIAVSRSLSESAAQLCQDVITTDYSESSITDAIEHLKSLERPFAHIFICNGLLHDAGFMPEKSVKQISLGYSEQLFRVNTIIPLLWLKGLTDLLLKYNKSYPCVVSVLSARVGSINDNKLGGWYSYRASKAALNMMLKCLAIEWARRLKVIKLFVFHPGTTDTPLSKPFQANVPEGKLFNADFVARRWLQLADSLEPDGELSFYDWDHQPIDW